jgi:hypothetical protein
MACRYFDAEANLVTIHVEARKCGRARVSRSAANLQRAFGEPAFEKVVEDVLDANAAMRAVDGCPLVYDCLGLPADQMHLHPAAARNIAKAVRATGARCIQVSSYWALSAAAALATQRSASAVRRP